MATSKAEAEAAGKNKAVGASQLATNKAAKVAAALSNASKAVGAFGKSSAEERSGGLRPSPNRQ